MQILIDTNIIIRREDDRIVEPNLIKLWSLLQKNGVKIVTHESAAYRDLNKDKDEERKRIILSKLASYPKIETEAPPSFIKKLYKTENPNDKIDAELLYALSTSVVDFILTEDGGIISKSKIIGLETRTFDILGALTFFEYLFNGTKPRTQLFIKNGTVASILPKLSGPFFNEFREDYDGFDAWIKSNKERLCYFIERRNEIKAIMILKEENEEIVLKETVLPKCERLKICSLKIDDDLSGNRLGEEFLRIAFHYAYKQNISEVYLTIFDTKEDLIGKILKFGFKSEGHKNETNELVFRKTIRKENSKNLDSFDYTKENYPLYLDKNNKKFLIPIQPKFCKLLFPLDLDQKQTKLFEGSIDPAFSNSIIKIYISKSRTKKLSRGDLVLFYKSGENRNKVKLISLGVIEDIIDSSSINEIIKFCGNRTVYTKKELEIILKGGGNLKAIKFWFIDYTKKVKSQKLKELKIAVPQSISEIPEDKFNKLKNLI